MDTIVTALFNSDFTSGQVSINTQAINARSRKKAKCVNLFNTGAFTTDGRALQIQR